MPDAPDKTPEQIEHEMHQTREAMSAKVSALESQVVGTVQTAADTFTDTVGAVRSLVDTAPGAVSDTVKQAADVVGEKMKEIFDISGHVQNHPWPSVAVSAGLGFLTGLIAFRGRSSGLGLGSAPSAPVASAYPAYMNSAPSAPAAPRGPGLFDELIAMAGRKVRELAETALETASAAANQSVRDNVPKLVDAATEAAGSKLNGLTARG
ncbi:DUF883 family protein [Gemmata sp.]|uniref:DUF883 family protein n=1 Tax=Gemmata sp. TaxID=1914242 RepID=UPI003F720E25